MTEAGDAATNRPAPALKPLRGARVLSLALNLPGPAALMRLKAMGATCLKAEPPAPKTASSGDPMGQYNPEAYATLHDGIKVVICEQLADPSKVKGIVPREVVRVVTPSMPFDDGGLEARKNLFLGSIEGSMDAPAVGIAVLDASTGELLSCEAEGFDAALSEVIRLDPRGERLGGVVHPARAAPHQDRRPQERRGPAVPLRHDQGIPDPLRP